MCTCWSHLPGQCGLGLTPGGGCQALAGKRSICLKISQQQGLGTALGRAGPRSVEPHLCLTVTGIEEGQGSGSHKHKGWDYLSPYGALGLSKPAVHGRSCFEEQRWRRGHIRLRSGVEGAPSGQSPSRVLVLWPAEQEAGWWFAPTVSGPGAVASSQKVTFHSSPTSQDPVTHYLPVLQGPPGWLPEAQLQNQCHPGRVMASYCGPLQHGGVLH